MNGELRQIKKIYGEEMMHLCRELFPTILEKEGLLLNTLKRILAPSHHFANAINEKGFQGDFKSWVYNHLLEEKQERVESSKTPFELMDEAGYILYECHSEKDIQSFKHLYASKEELCTFRGGRLNRCIVFFAVKKNVDNIKRENFPNPEREDEYGTSVISIQFSRDEYCTVSIKNRYNHAVKNPDSTFSNNLENIIPGLTDSFQKYCGINLHRSLNNEEFLSDLWYIQGDDGKYYFCNMASNGVLYCENNIIIINNKVIDQYAQNKERYVLIDQYIVDLKKKTIFSPIEGEEDAFIKSINDVGKIKSINIIRNNDNRIICFSYENDKKVLIEINKTNSIIRYKNDYVEKIGDSFMQRNPNVADISMSEVKEIGNRFLSVSSNINHVSLPQVEIIGNNFLMNAFDLKEIELLKVRRVGDNFLSSGRKLKSVSLPNVNVIGDHFLHYNTKLETISLPEVRIIGSHFLWTDTALKKIFLPKLESIGEEYFHSARIFFGDSLFNIDNKINSEIVRRKPRT